MRGLDFKPRNTTAEGFWGCAVADFRLAGSGGARYLYAECCDEQCGLDRDSMMARTDDPQGEEIAIERIQNLWKSFHPGSAQPEELELTTYNLGRRLTFFASMDSSSIAVIPRTPASALSIQVRLQMVSSLAKYQSLRFLLDIVVFNPKDQDKKVLVSITVTLLVFRTPVASNLIRPVAVSLPGIQAGIQRCTSLCRGLNAGQPAAISLPTTDVLRVGSNQSLIASITNLGFVVLSIVSIGKFFRVYRRMCFIFLLAHRILPKL